MYRGVFSYVPIFFFKDNFTLLLMSRGVRLLLLERFERGGRKRYLIISGELFCF